MANRNENNPAQAWADFAATGRVEDYLRYRAAENRAHTVTGVSGGVTQGYANSRVGAARRRNQRKRPPDHGAY